MLTSNQHAVSQAVRRRVARTEAAVGWMGAGAPLSEMLLRERFVARGFVWAGVLVVWSLVLFTGGRVMERSGRDRTRFAPFGVIGLGALLGLSPVVLGLEQNDHTSWVVATSVLSYAAIISALMMSGERRWHYTRMLFMYSPLLSLAIIEQVWRSALILVLVLGLASVFHEIATRTVISGIRTALSNEFLVRELEIANQLLSHETNHDGLTGLGNRALFTKQLEAAFGNPDAVVVAVSFIDIDTFKLVNDTHGHAVGDAVLVEVGRRLNEFCGESSVSARRSGDEFTVLHTFDPTSASETQTAQQLHRAITGPFDFGDGVLEISCSVGTAIRRSDDSTSSLLRHADEALYEAKRRGRARGVGFNELESTETIYVSLDSGGVTPSISRT